MAAPLLSTQGHHSRLEAVSRGDKRILLTLATGTGKTSIAFQIAWKLFQSRWNLSGEPTRRPRILFLADRNILADQAYNAFSAFPNDAIARITPGEITTNASVFFTIFQTFMTGEPEPVYKGYSEDFFDFIVIDECHRAVPKTKASGANHGALQAGRSAGSYRHAKHGVNADTYNYLRAGLYLRTQGWHRRRLPDP